MTARRGVRRRASMALRIASLLALGACGGPQNVLDPHGPAAERIAVLWWVMFWLATAVSLLVIVLLVHATRRARQRRAGRAHAEVNATRLVWAGGVVLPAIVLFGVLVYSFRTGTAVYPPAAEEGDVLTIEVTGHQFWWEVRYPEQGISTANQIHVPVGRNVRFVVRAPDVIHSFWIPQLHGKIDMVPGRINTVWIRADRPGAYRGQCAEYCGLSHALMAFWVIALDPTEFAHWVERRRAPTIEPASPEVRRGREVFFASGCAGCHGTRGAPLPDALGTPAPDLSDLATRRTLAAGTLPNNRAALADWIADPGAIKPGARMPGTSLTDVEISALLDYLQTLR